MNPKRNLFNTRSEQVLTQGLAAMTTACESLTVSNEGLRQEVTDLTLEIARLKDKLVTETSEKE